MRYAVMLTRWDSYFQGLRTREVDQVQGLTDPQLTGWAEHFMEHRTDHGGETLYLVPLQRIELSAYVPMGCGFIDQGWSTQVAWLPMLTAQAARAYLGNTECTKFLWNDTVHRVWSR